MKRPQSKFQAYTVTETRLLGQKSQNLSLGKNLSLGQNFLAAHFFLFIDILLKLQQQTVICLCKFSYNPVIIMGLLRFLTQ